MLANRLCIEEFYWVYVQNSTAIILFIMSFTYKELHYPIIKLFLQGDLILLQVSPHFPAHCLYNSSPM